VEGQGPVFLTRDTGQEALLAARYRLAGFQVEIAGPIAFTPTPEYPSHGAPVAAT
jgi:uroporphyrinogen-III synthase